MEALQDEWKEMFQKTLPKAATSKDPAQPKWPVHVDHCFARIILDKTCGVDVPWMQKLKSPAYKNMSQQQLQSSIDLGHQILTGEANLVELDNHSLEVRGKGKKASGKASGKMPRPSATNRKRKAPPTVEAQGEKKKSSTKKEKMTSQHSPSPKVSRSTVTSDTGVQPKTEQKEERDGSSRVLRPRHE